MPLKIKVTKIPNLNTLVIKQEGGRYFLAAEDSIVIDVPGLSYLIKFLLFSGYLSPRTLEGILEEYHSYAADEHYRSNTKEK